MIQLFAMLRRNPDLTHDEFLDHWHNVHGPLIRDTPELARHVRRYEQHPFASSGVGLDDVDGVAVQWFESMEDLAAFVAEPAYAERLRPDEERLLDLDALRVVFCEAPVVQIDGPASGPAGRRPGGPGRIGDGASPLGGQG